MPTKFPPWLKKKISLQSHDIEATRGILQRLGLNTVCQDARCPNISECFAQKTATFMILGQNCTRQCRYCVVSKGTPDRLDWQEAGNIAEAVVELGLKHVVITSVTRDDLPDGGAGLFAAVIRAIRVISPLVYIEVLTPDFQGDIKAVEEVVGACPDIFNHNLETVPRLYPRVRPQANYRRSLELLAKVKFINPEIYTKSGLMAGLGEETGEIAQVMEDLRSVSCDILTIGQYLQPSQEQLPVAEFITPETFQEYQALGHNLGFLYTAAGPFVRSSYQAIKFSEEILKN